MALNLVFRSRNLYLQQLCGPQSGILTEASVFAATMWPSIWYFDQGICIWSNYVTLNLVFWPRNLYLWPIIWDIYQGTVFATIMCVTLNLVFWPPRNRICNSFITLMLVFWPTNLLWTYRAPIFRFSSWGNFHPCARGVQTLRQGRFYWICSSAYVLVKQIV